MKTKSLSLLIIFLMISFSCQKTPDDTVVGDHSQKTPLTGLFKNGATCEVDLIAGQSYTIGTVSITFNAEADEVIIVYTITDPLWCLTEVHLDVQADPANFFTTNKGNPKVGHFAFSDVLNCEPTWTQVVDLTTITGWAEGDMIYIAAHAEVLNPPDIEESAWGYGTSFPGNSWAMYFECTPPSWECGDPLIDERDGQSYATVQIGTQCWMAENLNIGNQIDGIHEQTDNGTIEKYCYDDNPAKCNEYGGLYQWDEMMQYAATEGSQGICPIGWHLPFEEDWKVLGGAVDSQYGIGDPIWDNYGYRGYDAGTQLKTASGWSCGINISNPSGFDGLPGGTRDYRGYFYGIDAHGWWWISKQVDAGIAWHSNLYCANQGLFHSSYYKGNGFSVRCIKD